jgi:hypothetical protein
MAHHYSATNLKTKLLTPSSIQNKYYKKLPRFWKRKMIWLQHILISEVSAAL